MMLTISAEYKDATKADAPMRASTAGETSVAMPSSRVERIEELETLLSDASGGLDTSDLFDAPERRISPALSSKTDADKANGFTTRSEAETLQNQAQQRQAQHRAIEAMALSTWMLALSPERLHVMTQASLVACAGAREHSTRDHFAKQESSSEFKAWCAKWQKEEKQSAKWMVETSLFRDLVEQHLVQKGQDSEGKTFSVESLDSATLVSSAQSIVWSALHGAIKTSRGVGRLLAQAVGRQPESTQEELRVMIKSTFAVNPLRAAILKLPQEEQATLWHAQSVDWFAVSEPWGRYCAHQAQREALAHWPGLKVEPVVGPASNVPPARPTSSVAQTTVSQTTVSNAKFIVPTRAMRQRP